MNLTSLPVYRKMIKIQNELIEKLGLLNDSNQIECWIGPNIRMLLIVDCIHQMCLLVLNNMALKSNLNSHWFNILSYDYINQFFLCFHYINSLYIMFSMCCSFLIVWFAISLLYSWILCDGVFLPHLNQWLYHLSSICANGRDFLNGIWWWENIKLIAIAKQIINKLTRTGLHAPVVCIASGRSPVWMIKTQIKLLIIRNFMSYFLWWWIFFFFFFAIS